MSRENEAEFAYISTHRKILQGERDRRQGWVSQSRTSFTIEVGCGKKVHVGGQRVRLRNSANGSIR